MLFSRIKHLPLLASIFGIFFSSSILAQDYAIAPVPDWVAPVSIPAHEQNDQKNHSNGAAYLLVDRQWWIRDRQQFSYDRVVSKALNPSGVTEISQVSIDFDPEYESVTLNQLLIHRDGEVIDRIDRSRISLIQREKDLDYQIYDGSKTLNIFIEDVREGDIVEYSYTVEGANPVFSGHFAKQLVTRWSVPVAGLYYRVLWSVPRPLYVQNYGTDLQPEKKVLGKTTEYIWKLDDIEELISDADTPGWYVAYPEIYLSDIKDWEQVADWAYPLYTPVPNTASQKEIIGSILETASTQEERILKALRFVQDEVRYLGIEMGERSHKPHSPDDVLKQRFGDCKDKSLLLVSLLNGMGVEASPVLVNSDNGRHIKKMLPTPKVFNHAIVLAKHDGKNYWLDPTRNYQNGNLDSIYQPNYRYALVISDQSSDLAKMSEDINVVHSMTVEETFDVQDAFDKPTSYKIVTDYQRYYGDWMREKLSETSAKEIQQDYLNYMTQYFPQIKVEEKIKINDDSELNKITLNENYTIPKIWSVTDDEIYTFINFEPFLIFDYVKTVETPVRTMPYAVTHPVRYQHTTRVQVPKDSDFDSEFDEIKDKAFNFSRKVSFSNGVLVIDYVYESLSDHVAPEDIQAHIDNIARVHNLSSYEIITPNPAINFGEYSYDPNDINWMMVVVAILAILSIAFASYKYIYLYNPSYSVPLDINKKLSGINGWLILPCLGIILSPIKIFIQSNELWYIFSAKQWLIFEDQVGSGALFLAAFEMVCNIAMIIIALYLIVLFFQRRHTLPKLYIGFYILTIGIYVLDLLAVYLVLPEVGVERSDINELSRMVVMAAIWITYFMKSERVKATFTRGLNDKGQSSSDEAATTDFEATMEMEPVTAEPDQVKPVKTIAIGLLTGIVFVTIISAVLAVVFGLITGADIAQEEAMLGLANNSVYLVSDLLVTALTLILCGYIAVKYAPSEEIKYGLILGAITLVFYLAMYISAETIAMYPTWYLVLSIALVIPSVFVGAKQRVRVSIKA